MKQLFTAALVLLSFSLHAQLIGPSAPSVYIGKTFTAASASSPAVNVNRYDTVKFINCTFNGLLQGSGGSNLVVTGCTFNPITPVGSEQYPRAIDVYEPQALWVERCTFNSHTGGIRVDHRNQNTRSVVIHRNRFYNIDARNGYGQYTGNQRAAILVDGCVGIGGEISWNYIYNAPDSSCVEDNINLRNSGGMAGRNFPVAHNYIDGAYSYPVSLTTIPSVSGITIETGDESTYERVSQFVRVDSNYIVRTMNGGINMTSTHDVSSTGNRVVSSGKLPDGRQSYAFWAALAIWNGSNLPTDIWVRNYQRGNYIGLVRPGASNGGKDRNDVSTPETIALTDNYHLPNPITKVTEDSLLAAWAADTLRQFGGVAPGLVLSDTTIRQDTTIKYRFIPTRADGSVATATGFTYKSSAATVLRVTGVGDTFTLRGLKSGKAVLTVIYTSAGRVVAVRFTITVVSGEVAGCCGRIEKL